MPKILGIIPARGGSKGVPEKNIYPLAGLPLIAYTIKTAAQSHLLTDFVVSSDDKKIIALAKKFGGPVPFVRPARLAADKANVTGAAEHATAFMENKNGRPYDFIFLLQPTCPLRAAEDIDRSIKMLSSSRADSVASVCKVDDPHPGKMMILRGKSLRPFLPKLWREGIRRQDLPAVYFLNGAIYGVRRSVLMKKHSLWGKKTLAYEMPKERSVNIDSVIDIRLTEILLQTGTAS